MTSESHLEPDTQCIWKLHAFGNFMHLETSCFEMTARKQCFLTIYDIVHVLHRHHGYCFGCFFPIIRNIVLPSISSVTSSSLTAPSRQLRRESQVPTGPVTSSDPRSGDGKVIQVGSCMIAFLLYQSLYLPVIPA